MCSVDHQTINTRLYEFVSAVAMAEVAWVLQRSYRYPSSDIARAILRLLQLDTLVVENEQEIFVAMRRLKNGLGSFGDALIGALNARAGCRCTLTFDRKALRLPGFEQA